MTVQKSPYQFTKAPEVLTDAEQVKLMNELFGEAAELIKSRGGDATIEPDMATGLPIIVTHISTPALIGTMAELLFTGKWHVRLSPEVRRNIIINLLMTVGNVSDNPLAKINPEKLH